MHLYGLHCAPYHVALLIPLLNPFGADHEQVREVKDIAHLQQVHSLNQDQLLTKEKKTISCSDSDSQSKNGEGQHQGMSSLLQRC